MLFDGLAFRAVYTLFYHWLVYAIKVERTCQRLTICQDSALDDLEKWTTYFKDGSIWFCKYGNMVKLCDQRFGAVLAPC